MTAHARRRSYQHPFPHVGGFTYIGLLILLAILSVIAASSLHVGTLVQRRDAEQELLFIGKEFRDALQSYANATPVGLSPNPKSLDDLLRDPRYPGIKRHLRKIYADPITGKSSWGLMLNQEKTGVVGIYSLSRTEQSQKRLESPSSQEPNIK